MRIVRPVIEFTKALRVFLPDCQPKGLLEGIKPHHLRDTKKSLLHGVPVESISRACYNAKPNTLGKYITSEGFIARNL